MTILLRVVTFLLVLGIIVLVHELGHYIAARLMGIRVDVFSFGFGLRLFGRRFGATDFRISLLPIGGYVRLAGEEEYDPKNLKPDEFMAKNRGQRFFTLAMGAVMNILLTLVLLTVINMTGVDIESYKMEKPEIGYVVKDSPAAKAGLRKGDLILAIERHPVSRWREVEIAVGTNPKETLAIDFQRQQQKLSTRLEVGTAKPYEIGYAGFLWNLPAVIEDIQPGSPAQAAGLRQGDRIRAVDGQPVDNFFDLREIFAGSPGKTLQVTLLRQGTEETRAVTPRDEQGVGLVGFNVRIDSATIRYGLLASIGNSLRESLRLGLLTFNAFKKMIKGKLSPKNLSGPIEIAKFSQQALQSGLSNFFILIAFISLQLGIVNLFPIPGLDGGQLLILSVEALIRRDLNAKLKSALVYIGFSLLIMLMIFVILNDIAKTLPQGWKSLIPLIK